MGTASLLNLSASFPLFPQCYMTWWGAESSCMGLLGLSLLIGLVDTQETKGSEVRASDVPPSLDTLQTGSSLFPLPGRELFWVGACTPQHRG